MSPKAQQVLRDALQLPPRARADIAGTLLHSLDAKGEPGAEAAWITEISRRIDEVDAGKVKLISWKSARRRLRASLRRGRAKA
jgi:putative addiction module component (TIGR02574 family)